MSVKFTPVADKRWLRGTVQKYTFRFDCGFRVPIEEIAALTPCPLSYGDRVHIEINTVLVDTPSKHQHTWRCECGELKCE